MQPVSLRSRVSLALVPLLLFACGGKEDSKEPASCEASQAAVSSATYGELWTNVFSTQCGACHGKEGYQGTLGGPDLRTQASFREQLVGKKGSDYTDWNTFQNNRVECNGTSFIEAGSAATSMVVAVLDPTTKITGCDPVKSHLEAPQNICITAGNLAKLKEWINAGASE